LAIIGNYGWKCEEFLARAEAHPLRGKQLFLLRDVSDRELDYAYRHASALVIASEIEGFGLPVAEAIQRGLPVLCSDIPVFREVADGKVVFFGLEDPANLAREVERFIDGRSPKQRWTRTPHPWIGWRESAEQLFDAISAQMRASQLREPKAGE
jgi:O-antigen biosynthesis alpha-1,2-rhamnosyltransferase